MTTKEHAALQKLFNTLQDYDNTQTAMLKELQELNAQHGDGHRWCSWKANLDGIAKTDPGSIHHRRAEMCYETYMNACGAYEAMMDLGSTLAELGFWKEKKRGL